MADPRIGKQLPVVAQHAGHTVTVESTAADIEKPLAYWLRCSCGEKYLLGRTWLDKAIELGAVRHWELTDG